MKLWLEGIRLTLKGIALLVVTVVTLPITFVLAAAFGRDLLLGWSRYMEDLAYQMKDHDDEVERRKRASHKPTEPQLPWQSRNHSHRH